MHPQMNVKHWAVLLLTAVLYIVIAWGQQHIDSSLGGILFATIPIFSVLVAPVFLAAAVVTGKLAIAR